MINPSISFREIAMLYYNDMPWAMRSLLRSIGIKKNSDSSLTSYLLFEQAYTRHLIDIGYQDGLKQSFQAAHAFQIIWKEKERQKTLLAKKSLKK